MRRDVTLGDEDSFALVVIVALIVVLCSNDESKPPCRDQATIQDVVREDGESLRVRASVEADHGCGPGV